MNLDDFSYEENGRRYIDPNVSLNEQNAFIQNLRDTQVQRNDQIAQQTHNLGTDVPSNLGGLNGSEAYFNSRYQTPQTNSLVGNLKAAAQAQALTTALNNELQKAQKRYNDAYYAAKDRERNANNTTTSGDGDTLTINTNTDDNGTIKQNDKGKGGRGRLDFVTDTPRMSYEKKVNIYTDMDGNVYVIRDLTDSERWSNPYTGTGLNKNPRHPDTNQPLVSGDMFNYQGKTFLYLNNDQTRGPVYYIVEANHGKWPE